MNPFKKEIRADFEIFTILDSKGQIYKDPLFALNQFDMVRSIETLFSNPQQEQSIYLTNAEDFSLFKIGSFDKKTGTINAHQPEHILNLIDLKTSLMAKNQKMGIVST